MLVRNLLIYRIEHIIVHYTSTEIHALIKSTALHVSSNNYAKLCKGGVEKKELYYAFMHYQVMCFI